ncbi:DUF2115 family protein [Methanobrevibacter smithii]|uniref:DUF2115 family protein n=1 Tax=Methanobrevibacter smithii TaxID=2173 RepID=UPI00384B5220
MCWKHDNNDLKKYIFNLNETLDPHKSSAEFCIIVFLSILYSDYILEEPVHPEGAEFPESQKALKKKKNHITVLQKKEIWKIQCIL